MTLCSVRQPEISVFPEWIALLSEASIFGWSRGMPLGTSEQTSGELVLPKNSVPKSAPKPADLGFHGSTRLGITICTGPHGNLCETRWNEWPVGALGPLHCKSEINSQAVSWPKVRGFPPARHVAKAMSLRCLPLPQTTTHK